MFKVICITNKPGKHSKNIKNEEILRNILKPTCIFDFYPTNLCATKLILCMRESFDVLRRLLIPKLNLKTNVA